MEFKTFKCELCGKKVSKRKSISFKDGRICKTHEESKIIKAKKQLIEKIPVSVISSIKKKMDKRDWMSTHCHVCGCSEEDGNLSLIPISSSKKIQNLMKHTKPSINYKHCSGIVCCTVCKDEYIVGVN